MTHCYSLLSEKLWHLFSLDTFTECTENFCLNGATCMETENGPVCQCAFGWEGDNCEIGKWEKMFSPLCLQGYKVAS